jgi:hypothetical protein
VLARGMPPAHLRPYYDEHHEHASTWYRAHRRGKPHWHEDRVL